MSLWSPFSPAQPWARQDAPFSQVAMARRNVLKVRPDNVSDGPSLRSQAVTVACGSVLAEQRRPSAFGLPLVCRLPRAQGLTRLILPFLCAFGEQGRPTVLASLMPPLHFLFLLC